jgi:DNA processing protein
MPASRRDLLIALNADLDLARAAVCRLAQTLDRWHRRRRAEPERLGAELGVPAAAVERALAAACDAGRRAAAEQARAERAGARIVTCHEAAYPPLLRHLPLPPAVLYVRGALPDGPALAIVGSRRAGPYGLEAATLFARALAAAGVAVVSGFARGVDAAAHRGALAAGGVTVAVLGCGVDVDYPRGHRRLGAALVAGGGAVVSELPCGAEPRAWNFPVRNRIIAALALGTLVVEAAARSGSLITARHALELNRDVLAVPGRIFDERAMGPNTLIAAGAVPARHPRDILETLGLPVAAGGGEAVGRAPAGGGGTASAGGAADGPKDGSSAGAQPAEGDGTLAGPPLPALQGRLLAALVPGDPRPAEAIAAAAGVTVDRALAGLLELELAGWAQRYPGPAWGRKA